jgi:hypothetical protein
VNTATVNGYADDGLTQPLDPDVDTAEVQLEGLAISCVKLAYSEADTDGNPEDNHVTLASGTTALVEYSVEVTNDGTVAAEIVELDDPMCGDPIPVSVIVAPGETVTIALCEVEITCEGAGEMPNTVVVTAQVAEEEGICDYDIAGNRISTTTDCSARVDCEGICVTRTPGYWFTHWRNDDPTCVTLERAIVENGGVLDLGFITLPTADVNDDGVEDYTDTLHQALSYFWGKKSKVYDPGQDKLVRADALCKFRKKLAFHLIPAIANTVLLGTNPAGCVDGSGELFPEDLIEQAVAAGAGCDVQAIKHISDLLDQFNNSGDDASFPETGPDGEEMFPCKADPRGAKDIGKVTHPSTTENCDAGCEL